MLLNSIVKALQKFIAADKTVLAATLLQAAVALAASLGFKLDGTEVGVLSALIAAGLGYLVHVHVSLKLAVAKPCSCPAPEAKPAE